jgi:phage FluMu gp28-like protein
VKILLTIAVSLALALLPGCEGPSVVEPPQTGARQLVAFGATWCRACQQDKPALAQIEQTVPTTRIDSDPMLSRFFLPYQVHWIQVEDSFHAQKRQVFALAEKSVRIGWTYADAFKNVRKRLRFKKRDYLFATKDYPSALEYMELCYRFAGLFDFTRAVLSHGEEFLKVPRLDPNGHPTGFTDEVKIGLIKFDNGSRIIAFSSSPRAMAVHAGDVGLDEFAKHPNARLLWETAQGRVTWGFDLAVWSAHDGEDTLFNEFAQEARAAANAAIPQPSIPIQIEIQNQNSKFKNPPSPWNLYYRVSITDAIELGLLNLINRVQKTNFTSDQFVTDCRARARDEEIFQQAYLCNPLGATSNHIVEWSAIERCRQEYQIERVHLEAEQVLQLFGEFAPYSSQVRESKIADFLCNSFPSLLSGCSASPIKNQNSKFENLFRLGFDVAASGQGDLATIYIDEARGDELSLRALFTCRTEDWHFLKTVLFYFLENLSDLQAAGDETGLGRQICWEAAAQFGGSFLSVNFASKKHDLGFSLMNQLSVTEKRFPKSEQDIAADYFALRKTHNGTKWVFSEGHNTSNPASHCDIAWAGALATHAHTERPCEYGAAVC